VHVLCCGVVYRFVHQLQPHYNCEEGQQLLKNICALAVLCCGVLCLAE
jgi:hypothetical protein